MSSIKSELIPSENEMFEWTTAIFNQGIRRPGYPADYKTELLIKNQFKALGLEKITLDPIKVKKWEVFGAHLKIWPIGKPNKAIEIPCFPIPYTKSTKNLEGELTLIKDKTPISKKIGVAFFGLFKFPLNVIPLIPGLDRYRYYDPENQFDELEQLVPLNFQLRNILDSKILKDALGFIGILSGYPWDTDKFYFPYDAVERNLPGVYVSAKNGKKISELMKKGTIRANISSRTKISEVISHNITGSLQGNSEEWIIIGSHHDGPWNSAVEDASGMTLVLAQAKYWSQLPPNQRPFNMMFLMNCAHMAGAKGAIKFVEKNKDLLEKTITAIHLEHIARDVKIEEEKLIPLNEPTPRWWFVSRIAELEDIVENAIKKEDLKRSIIFPPENFPPGSDKPPTDGCFYHTKAIPLISFLTAPPYLFDPDDTLDKVHKESYIPLTRAIIHIINELKKYNAKELRALVLDKKD